MKNTVQCHLATVDTFFSLILRDLWTTIVSNMSGLGVSIVPTSIAAKVP